MTKRNEDWIKIQEPNGASKIASPRYIRGLLGLENVATDSRVTYLFKKVLKIEDMLVEERLGQARERILAFIKNSKTVDTKALHTFLKLGDYPLWCRAMWKAKSQLEEQKVIHRIPQGRGHSGIWEISIVPENTEKGEGKT